MRYLIYSFQALSLYVLCAQEYYSNQSISETVSSNLLLPQNSLLKTFIFLLLLLCHYNRLKQVCNFCLTLKPHFDPKISIHLHICNTSLPPTSLHEASCNILRSLAKTTLSLLLSYRHTSKQQQCCLLQTALWVLIHRRLSTLIYAFLS